MINRDNIIDCLNERKMIHDMSPNIKDLLLEKKKAKIYVGFDLSADSLQIGNLAAIILLKYFQRYGYSTVCLIGSATSMIGDPSFKAKERELIDEEEIRCRKAKILNQLKRLLSKEDSLEREVLIVDNNEWLGGMPVINFLREAGKYLTVNYMQSKDSVRERMQTGISYTEFTYQLFQAYDFYYLNSNFGVNIQVGGADQWGNITSGIELIRKKSGEEVGALTIPLITREDGTKFGKSESGKAIWLDGEKTSAYEFYQFWLNTTDEEAERYIKVFTFLSLEEINIVIERHKKGRGERILQRRLAEEVTSFVHTKDDSKLAIVSSEVMFGIDFDPKTIDRETFEKVFVAIPRINIDRQFFDNAEISTLLVSGVDRRIFSSKSDLMRMIKDGGVYINKKRIIDLEMLDKGEMLIYDKFLVLQKGKKNYFLLVVE